ncbi:hypothetical protein QQS21_004257 [Conoideocrella luteorostrata]|uniref:NRPS-like enzyme n=1 Tax=Conoideocrella luteorostrata TaxID=1105319 RepID=A0AAJ0CRV7_9HYPO|nr:hypothetical protein QQS21_004257 [Conoideocrella luteorostrata]
MSHLTKEYIEYLHSNFGELKVLDDIIRHRAGDEQQVPILGYPRTEDKLDDYEEFTGQQLDQFIDNAVKYYIRAGMKANTREVVGIYAPSDVDFVVSFFALSRLGYTVMCLSLRLAPLAIKNLLRETKCRVIAHGPTPQIAEVLEAVAAEEPLMLSLVPNRAIYGLPRSDEDVPFRRFVDRERETDETALIMHSSGSTGLPKPVFLTHRNLLMHPLQGSGLKNFGALPLYHMYGLSVLLQGMYMGKTANLLSATLPLTTPNLVTAIEATGARAIHVVPYVLGLISASEQGLKCLQKAKYVTACGARTPDELGDHLIAEGVNFGVVFGTTEAGLLGDTMDRDAEDDSWSYIRIYQNIRKSIYMQPLGDGTFECVYLKTHPGLSTSNSDDPEPGSWHSKDVFMPHPSLPDVWKYVTRLDDRVTLSNGEKVLPLPIEGRVRQHPLVREAVVFGIDRAIPGIMLFRHEKAADMPDDTFIDQVWPAIVSANSRSEGFSQIVREMVLLQPSDASCPQTDKGSIIRGQAYRKFAREIDEVYARLDSEGEGTLRLDVSGIEGFLQDTYQDIVGAPLQSLDLDFFTAGVDSLRAIQMRRVIQNKLYLASKQLEPNVVYEFGNARKLARHLYSIAQGEDSEELDRTSLMRELIAKYSERVTAPTIQQGLWNGAEGNAGAKETVILTGATGSLGAHLLKQLIADPQIAKVYCLVRGEDPSTRIRSALRERGFSATALVPGLDKIVALTAKLDEPDFGVGEEQMIQFTREVSLIVHLAWPVNFNIGLQSFEPHLAGLTNLISLSTATTKEPGRKCARFFFASSISAAENSDGPCVVDESPILDLNRASKMGYAQSKLVGEHIVLNAAQKGAASYVLRIGQVVGDRHHGIWNEAEFIPSMIRSALSMQALPELNEKISWLPVDTLATVIRELAIAAERDMSEHHSTVNKKQPPAVYNLVNPNLFSWSDLLPELRRAGLKFESISMKKWLAALKTRALMNDDVEAQRNPAVKLLQHFEERYDTPDGSKAGSILFDTKVAQSNSVVLRAPPDIIGDGYVRKFVESWLKQWVPAMA